jgi:uncharacterized protein (DUF58 family)
MLDGALLRRLERLRLEARRAPVAAGPGERRSRVKGRSLDFAEHRDYVPGDDVRHLDWNAYARLDRLLVKLYQEERDQTVTILVDRSASMAGPKLDLARRLAAALAYIGLGGYDRVGLAALGETLGPVRSPTRGRSQAPLLFRFLEKLSASGVTDLDASLTAFVRRYPRPGQVFVISDFLQEGAGLQGLSQLRYARNQVTAVQVLSPEERDPGLSGDLKLVDVETADSRELTVTHGVLAAYRAELAALCASLAGWASRHGCTYLEVSSSDPLEELVTSALRRSGVLS